MATTVRFKCLMCTKGGLALCSAELVLNYKYKGDKSCFYDLYSGCHKSFIDLHCIARIVSSLSLTALVLKLSRRGKLYNTLFSVIKSCTV